jgi:hypothetical protein
VIGAPETLPNRARRIRPGADAQVTFAGMRCLSSGTLVNNARARALTGADGVSSERSAGAWAKITCAPRVDGGRTQPLCEYLKSQYLLLCSTTD